MHGTGNRKIPINGFDQAMVTRAQEAVSRGGNATCRRKV